MASQLPRGEAFVRVVEEVRLAEEPLVGGLRRHQHTARTENPPDLLQRHSERVCLAVAQGGGYFDDRYVSSFIGGAPLDDPRIVVLCVIDDPDKSRGHYGGAIAGPVVRDIIDYTLTYLGVEPDAGDDHDASLAAAD